MRKIKDHHIDWNAVADGLGLSVSKVIEMFNDGRIVSRLGEFLHEKSEKGKRQNENSKFDIREQNNIRSEVRSITDTVSFASSKEVGSGRKVTEEGFKEKLNSLDRFILIDKRGLLEGKLGFIEVTKNDLETLGLGINKSVSAKKFFKKYDTIK